MKRLGLIFIIILFTPLNISANEDSHDHDHEDEGFIDHHSHEHGYVEVNISNFEETINLEFIFPANDIFGFEHAPRNEQQEKTVSKQLEVIRDQKRIFSFDPVCELVDVKVKSELASKHHEHEDEHHDEHKESHHEHEDEHHDEHDEEVHSDVFVNYVASCNTEESINVTFELFAVFPTVEELRVRYVSDNGQDTATITSDNNVFKLP